MGALVQAILYPKGMQITCPSCGHLIATANRDILATDPGNHHDYDSPYPIAGFAMVCPECETNHLRAYPGRPGYFQVHTPEGWR